MMRWLCRYFLLKPKRKEPRMKFWRLIRLLGSIDSRLSSVEESIKMADLSALKAVVSDLSSLKDQIVAALQNSGVPQSEIDAITAEVQSNVDAFRAALPQ